MIRHAPGAVRLEKGWMRDVPKTTEAATAILAETYGFDASILSHMNHEKPRRALAAMLRHNLDEEQSKLGIGLKALVGLAYANYVGNAHLTERAIELARHSGIVESTIDAASGFFPGSTAAESLDERTTAALSIARVMSPSPAIVDQESVDLAEASLSSEEIIEAAVWISVNQLMHRLTLFYGIDGVK